jgi:hypothetical protein
MHETELETAQRHVADGADFIERQRALIEYLQIGGRADVAGKAQALLKDLIAIQAEHLVHLRQLTVRNGKG